MRDKEYLHRIKKMMGWTIMLVILESILVWGKYFGEENTQMALSGTLREQATEEKKSSNEEKEYIKWVDFKISYEALCAAYDWDVETHGSKQEVHWIPLLAYTAAKTGGEFDKKSLKILEEAAKKISKGEDTIENLSKNLKYYGYYEQAYEAALGGLVGEYQVSRENGKMKNETINHSAKNTAEYQTEYGLKGFFPLAYGFDYTHYDDFGAGRSYGYQRRHLGHDMMGLVGVPIIAIESGYVEALGWNQYGGWRIGVRSMDGKRYYYYAHLRQNYPYAEGLEEGSYVTAGDVIGYMGHTGYSAKENTNNIKVTHLHWGLELIFDESQKESDNEIWIDVYALTRFLAKHKQKVEKIEGTKEWIRTTWIKDPVLEEQKFNK